MSTLYNLFRQIVGDTSSPYTIIDARLFRYLDLGIAELSKYVDNRKREEITITSADITNGYFDVTYNIERILEFKVHSTAYRVQEGKRIEIVNGDYISAGTYTIEYNAFYKMFEGEDREDSYFNYPSLAEMGILLHALGVYMDDQEVHEASGEGGVIKKKSEQGMTVEYSVGGESRKVTTSGQARKQAGEIFANLPNAHSKIFGFSLY